MGEEFEPIKKVDAKEKNKEIRDEIANDIDNNVETFGQVEKEPENNLESRNETVQENNQPVEKKKTGNKILRFISRILYLLIILFVIFEVVIGILNMQRLNNDKEPIWYFSSTQENTKTKKEIRYHLGLYVIVKTTEGGETRLVLKPFFLQ